MKPKRKRSATNRLVTVPVLRRTVSGMLPFYSKIVRCPRFAARWARAVRKADLSRMEKMLRKAAPGTARKTSLAVNGIGYFVDFNARRPIYQYVNATSIRPGTVQFYFNNRVHRSIACAILPLYRKLAVNKRFASDVVRAIRTNNKRRLSWLIRSQIKSKALCTISIRHSGFSLGFKYPFSPYTVYNECFQMTY